MKIKLYYIISFIFIFTSCDVENIFDPKLPSWNIDVEIPLIEKTLALRENILDIDSSVTIYPDINTVDEYDSIFVYKLEEKIDSTFIDDKLSIEDVIDTTITQSVDDINIEDITSNKTINFSDVGIESVSSGLTTEIGLISLDDISQQETDPYTFESLLPDFYASIQTFLDTSGDPSLGDTPYDENQLGTINNEEIVPTSNLIEFESFQYANFDSGVMIINIDNSQMYLNFENMLLEMKNQSTDEIITSVNLGTIESGQIYNDIINLGELPNNGYLPNQIDITISGTVNSIANNVTYNQLLSSQIDIGVSAIDLFVAEASAQIPAQSFNDTGSFLLENENKILDATINTGYLLINLQNNLPANLDGDISINIPNILNLDGEVLSISFNLSDTVDPIDLNQYEIRIDDIDDQQIFYSYEVLTTNNDDYIVINQTDNVDISFELVGDITDIDQQITFSSINGVIESQENNVAGDVELEIDGATIQSALFESGEIIVEIINNISDAPINLEIVIDEIFDNGQPFTENIVISGSQIETFSLENHVLSPTYDDDLPKIFYNAIAVSSDPSANEYNLLEDISVNLSIQNIIIKEVTGYFNQDPIVETSIVNLESDNIIKEGILESGNIEISISNNLGLLADVNFSIDQILDSNGNIFSYSIPLDDPEEIVNIDLTNHSLLLDNDVDSEMYQKVTYTSEVVINSDELSTLNLENNIEITFNIPELTFSYIEGYIAPVEVEIEPFSKSDLTILPDDVEGIIFNNANAYLDFDSELELDLNLELDFYSTNTESGDEYIFQFSELTTTSIDRIYLDSNDIINMINIIPDSISVSGLATVSGNGIINSSDAIAADFTIEVPFEFLFTDQTSINIPSSELSAETVPEDIESMIIFYQYLTPFNFNTSLSVYCSNDTTTIVNNSNKFIDLSLIPSNNIMTDSIEVNSDKFDLFSSSEYLKPILGLQSPYNENNDFIPYSFYSTDSIDIKLWTRIKIKIDNE